MSIIIFAITEAMAVFEVCIVTVILYKQLGLFPLLPGQTPSLRKRKKKKAKKAQYLSHLLEVLRR